MLKSLLLKVASLIVRFLFWILADISITGRENVPKTGPLLIVANHFSLFEVPLIATQLPLKPIFFAAAELWEEWQIRWALWLNDSILVRRGRADRHALKRALAVLKTGGVLAIFPEGGITAESVELASQGDTAAWTEGTNSRADAQLLPAQPGVAFLALRTQVPILPVGFLGTEKMGPNLRRLKRTRIKIHIGKPFGPFVIDPLEEVADRRTQMRMLGHHMMERVAQLMPPENRGYYRQ